MARFNIRQALIYMELTIVVVLWGLVPLVMKLTALDMGPGMFNLLRFVLSALLLAALFHRDIRSPGKRNLCKLIGLGMFTLFPFSYLFLVGVSYVDISTAGMVQGSAPALTVLISALLLRTPPTPVAMASVGVTYAGLLLFLGHSGQGGGLGAHAALGIVDLGLAMVSFSLYTILSKRIGGAVKNGAVILYASVGAAIAAVPFALYDLHTAVRPLMTWNGLWGVAYMALFATAVSFLLYTKAVRAIGPVQASLFTNFVPIVIVLSGVVALGERLNGIEMAAIGLVMTGVMLSNSEPYLVRRLAPEAGD